MGVEIENSLLANSSCQVFCPSDIVRLRNGIVVIPTGKAPDVRGGGGWF